jgi:hypothetical protein
MTGDARTRRVADVFNTDVLRQVPLLRRLGGERFPVPPIVDAIEDET